MGLKILHLSDIHFKNYKDLQYLDLDKDIQREIEIDLDQLRKSYGQIDIILIGGDIAFSGTEEEFAIADAWINRICTITGCKLENVLTVPGNHDVDRSKINAAVKSIQSLFKGLRGRNNIDRNIADYMADAESAAILLSPLQNYRTFAQKYGSVPDSSNNLYWEKDFNLDGRILRIRGVNSALISNKNDDEYTSKLILGSHQSNIVRDAGVITFVVCHHPPQWLYDGDEVKRDFNAKAKVHLFGHKHSFGSDRVNNSLVLSAGAMQPSRSETDWEPRYNIIEVAIDEESASRHISVKLFKRKWEKNDQSFIAEYSRGGVIYEQHDLPLSDQEWLKVVVSEDEIKVKAKEEEVNESESKDFTMTQEVIDPRAPDPKRKLAFMFLGLPYHVKLNIAVKLSLIEDSDRDLEEIRKAQNYFKRATERNLLGELWDEVVLILNSPLPNPFK
nr:metallophosphoesterase [uncultured Flavobacterium sp.]